MNTAPKNTELDLEIINKNKYPVDDTDILMGDNFPILLSEKGVEALVNRIRFTTFDGKTPNEVLGPYMKNHVWKIMPHGYGDSFSRDFMCLVTKDNEDVTSSYDDDVLFAFGIDSVDLWDVMDLREDLDLETVDTYEDELGYRIYFSDKLNDKILKALGINKETLPEEIQSGASLCAYDGIGFLSWLSKKDIQKRWYTMNKLQWKGDLIIYAQNDYGGGNGVIEIYEDDVDLFLDRIGHNKKSIGLQEDLDLEPIKNNSKIKVQTTPSSINDGEHKTYFIDEDDIETKSLIIDAIEETGANSLIYYDLPILKSRGMDSNVRWRIETTEWLSDFSAIIIVYASNAFISSAFDLNIIMPVLKSKIEEDLDLEVSENTDAKYISAVISKYQHFLCDCSAEEVEELFFEYGEDNCWCATSTTYTDPNPTNNHFETGTFKDMFRLFHSYVSNAPMNTITTVRLYYFIEDDFDCSTIFDITLDKDKKPLEEDLDLDVNNNIDSIKEKGIPLSEIEVKNLYDEIVGGGEEEYDSSDDYNFKLYLKANESGTNHDYGDCSFFPWAILYEDGNLFDAFTDKFANSIFPNAVDEWNSVMGENKSLHENKSEELDLDVSNEEIKDICVNGNYQDANNNYTHIVKKLYEDGEIVLALFRGKDEYDEGLDIDLFNLWYDNSRDYHEEEPNVEYLVEVHNINDVIKFGKEYLNLYNAWESHGRVLSNPTALLFGPQKEGILWGETELKDYTKEYKEEEVDIIKENLDLDVAPKSSLLLPLQTNTLYKGEYVLHKYYIIDHDLCMDIFNFPWVTEIEKGYIYYYGNFGCQYALVTDDLTWLNVDGWVANLRNFMDLEALKPNSTNEDLDLDTLSQKEYNMNIITKYIESGCNDKAINIGNKIYHLIPNRYDDYYSSNIGCSFEFLDGGKIVFNNYGYLPFKEEYKFVREILKKDEEALKNRQPATSKTYDNLKKCINAISKMWGVGNL